MKKEDLMIGDWVYIGEPDDFHGYIAKAVIINGETGYITVHIPNMHLHDVFVDDLQPIPLTKEIMLKNGFNLYPEETNVFCLNAEYRHDLDTVCLYIGDIERPSIYGNDSLGEKIYIVLHCKYVHELQHLLKSCGIEKEIVL